MLESSITRADKERAYVLHTRPYSETSVIGNFFTRSYGVVNILVRGAKRKKGYASLLQPNMELSLSWSGRRDLKTMRSVDLSHRHHLYDGASLTILVYINEILIRLLQPCDAHVELYDHYHSFMLKQDAKPAASNLRKLERQIFAALGYAVSWNLDYKTAKPIERDKDYIYDPNNGFTKLRSGNNADSVNHIGTTNLSPADAITSSPTELSSSALSGGQLSNNTFSGDILLRMQAEEYDDPQVNKQAKQLSRLIIFHLMGNRELMSRKLVGSKTK